MRSISSAFVCRLLAETPAFFLSFIYDDKNDWVSIQRYSYQSGTLHNVKSLSIWCFSTLSELYRRHFKWAAANQSFAVTMAEQRLTLFHVVFFSPPFRLWTLSICIVQVFVMLHRLFSAAPLTFHFFLRVYRNALDADRKRCNGITARWFH